jgi:hypothetical protein
VIGFRPVLAWLLGREPEPTEPGRRIAQGDDGADDNPLDGGVAPGQPQAEEEAPAEEARADKGRVGQGQTVDGLGPGSGAAFAGAAITLESGSYPVRPRDGRDGRLMTMS